MGTEDVPPPHIYFRVVFLKISLKLTTKSRYCLRYIIYYMCVRVYKYTYMYICIYIYTHTTYKSSIYFIPYKHNIIPLESKFWDWMHQLCQYYIYSILIWA